MIVSNVLDFLILAPFARASRFFSKAEIPTVQPLSPETVKKDWESLQFVRLIYCPRSEPVRDGFTDEAAMKVRERELFNDIYARGWQIFMEGRAYMIEGFAWKIIDYGTTAGTLRRSFSPIFLTYTHEQPNILYRMLWAMHTAITGHTDVWPNPVLADNTRPLPRILLRDVRHV